MSKIDELIKEKCPDGVDYKLLSEVATVLRGKRLTKSMLSDDGYPVFHGGLEPLGYYSESNRRSNMTMVINVGASAGTVGFCDKDFWSSDGCFCIQPNEAVMDKYIFYYLQSNEHLIRSGVRIAGIPTLDMSTVEKITIPVPPLEIQKEIVSVLDSFIELEAELEARRKQYEHYRDQLLSFENLSAEGGQVEWLPLEDVCALTTGATPSRTVRRYWDGGTIPWMNSGEVNLRRVFSTEEKITEEGYAKTSTTIVPAHSVVMALAGQGKTRGKVAITEIDLCTNQSLCSMTCNDKMSYKYLFHYLDSKYDELRAISNGDGTRGGLSLRILKPYRIPVPDKKTQAKIVDILDKFETVCGDIESGLPAEIEARHKQYVYYRDKLLTFKEKTA